MTQLPLTPLEPLAPLKRLAKDEIRCSCGYVVKRTAWSLARKHMPQFCACPGCGKRVEFPAQGESE